MNERPRASRAGVAAWAAPLTAALVVRLAAGFATPPGPQGIRGFDFYGYMADNLIGGRGLSWIFYEGLGWKHANRAPLYPALVALVRWFAGSPGREALIVLQSVAGAAAVGAAALLARRWGGTRAMTVALWIGAFWPYSVLADTGLIEHVVYAPLTILALWTALRAGDSDSRAVHHPFASGVVCGLATLARLTFAVTLPAVVLWTLWRRGLRAALLVSVGMVLVLAPWVARNHAVVGHWTLGTDGGRALWVGNSPLTYTRYPDESIDEGERDLFRKMDPALAKELRGLGGDEVAQDDRFRDLAVAAIASDPPAAVFRGMRRAGALWSVVYNPGPTHWTKLAVFAASFTALLIAACAGVAVQPRLRQDLPLVLAFLLSFTLVAAVFWGQPRYLAPLHGIGIAAAAAWIARRPGGRA